MEDVEEEEEEVGERASDFSFPSCNRRQARDKFSAKCFTFIFSSSRDKKEIESVRMMIAIMEKLLKSKIFKVKHPPDCRHPRQCR